MKFIEVNLEKQGRPKVAQFWSSYSSSLKRTDVDDTPVDGATTTPISSNWAHDYIAELEEKLFFRDLLVKAILSIILGTDWTNVELEEIDWEEIASSELDLSEHENLNTGVHGAGTDTLVTNSQAIIWSIVFGS